MTARKCVHVGPEESGDADKADEHNRARCDAKTRQASLQIVRTTHFRAISSISGAPAS